MIYDITPAITEKLAVWPQDTPPCREVLSEISDGSSVTLSTLHATVHLGAHADAPSHYAADAPTIDQRPIDHYLGRCQVIRVDVPRATGVEPEGVTTKIEAKRVLFATGTFPDPCDFNEDFAALSPALLEVLGEQGARLIGIDTPSVDLFDSKDLPVHKTAAKHDISILEGLALADVPEGLYELIALPLKLVGFDGSPVRAILRTASDE